MLSSPLGVRRREHEDAVGSAERVETVEEGARIVEVLDHLARDDHLGRREAEGADCSASRQSATYAS